MEDKKLWVDGNFHCWPLFQAFGAWALSERGRWMTRLWLWVSLQREGLVLPGSPHAPRPAGVSDAGLRRKLLERTSDVFWNKTVLWKPSSYGESLLCPSDLLQWQRHAVSRFSCTQSFLPRLYRLQSFQEQRKSLSITVFLFYNIICNWHPGKAM